MQQLKLLWNDIVTSHIEIETLLQGWGDRHHHGDWAAHGRPVGGAGQHHRGQADHRGHQDGGRRQLHLRAGEHGPWQHPPVNIARWASWDLLLDPKITINYNNKIIKQNNQFYQSAKNSFSLKHF